MASSSLRQQMLDALKEVDRLYSLLLPDRSAYALQAHHKDCGPMINAVRDAIAKAESK